MEHGATKTWFAGLSMGWVAAAGLAASPVVALAQDGHGQAAATAGTAEFEAQVWMPASGAAAPGSPASRDAGALETGAASGEPLEAAEPVASPAPADERAAREHQQWVESIWNSP